MVEIRGDMWLLSGKNLHTRNTMNRRSFLQTLVAGITAAQDPEKLLWEPGKRLISIPKTVVIQPRPVTLNVGDIFTIAGRYAVNPHVDPATGKEYKFLQRFIATGTFTATTVPEEDTGEYKFFPPSISHGPYQNVEIDPYKKGAIIFPPYRYGKSIGKTHEMNLFEAGLYPPQAVIED